jgi:hypothetical protein
MELKYRHIASVSKDGKKILFENKGLFDRHVASLAGKNIEVFLRQELVPASTAKKSYFHMILKEAYTTNMFSGYDKPIDIYYEVLAPMFTKTIVVRNGELTEDVPKLSEIFRSQERTDDLIEKTKIFLTQQGIEVGESKNYKL